MKVIKIINEILFFGLLLTGIVLLFFSIGKIYTMLVAFGSFFASWATSIILKKNGISSNYEIPINLALWLNLYGELIAYYTGFLFYDKILHFSVAILITAIIYEYYSKNLKPKKDMIFLTVLGMLCLWEIFEYSIWIFTGYPSVGVYYNGQLIQTPYNDTMYDLIFGCFGSLVYLIIKSEKIDKTIQNKLKIRK
jgi:hypothetical protein